MVPALGRTLAALFIAAPLLPATQEPFLNYTLRVDPTDLSSVNITLQVSNAPAPSTWRWRRTFLPRATTPER
jgi:hypothetical protein